MPDAALIALVVGIVGPLLAYLTATQARHGRQLAEARAELDAAEVRERVLWGYVRALIDQVYRLGGTPVDPPDYLDDLFPSRPRKETP
ncbi:hypothetical protein [Leucobacter ruminantium]|uniref:Uncharacterized protein n=1 Tax=Leucobacter ruminantium TaxID=1289170 RepID=A0A939LZE5_9MICO|nr:hypothetical protein [Leucobacter ruminantium]MBO1805893.1 hypothetical protein [Leucobacter ruminantium]